MKLTLISLERCFKSAIENSAKYIAVKINTRGSSAEEIIINPKENIISKLNYYKKAYTDDLVLKSYDGIRITGITYGDTFEEIEKDLIGKNLR
ncbi:hypothetical protein TPELB_23630 [Terrisporobacter petrolearius]|uniref:Uncharacterized protein n=1 Tax=Terrisporobacter petrolearius TaxID=1460447 RepID=A0ABZ3FE53_9FIRM